MPGSQGVDVAHNINDLVTTNEPWHISRLALLETANELKHCLEQINRYGEEIDRSLAVQAEAHCYGSVHDGLLRLVAALFPDDGVFDRAGKILERMFDSDLTVQVAARMVADDHAPMAGQSTAEVRDYLVQQRAWLRTLNDGMLPPSHLVASADKSEAVKELESRISECLEALAYRGEPEVAGD